MAAQKGTKSVLDYIRANCPKVFAACPFQTIIIFLLFRLAVGEAEEGGRRERGRKGRGERAGQVLIQKMKKLPRFVCS